jgi:hypothetical protein
LRWTRPHILLCPTASYLSFNWGTRFQPFCNPFELKGWKDEAAWPQPARDLAVVLYIHYISKAYEFVDTLIMILKKNNRQVRSGDSSRPGWGGSQCAAWKTLTWVYL